METKEIITNPLTIHLRAKGMTLKGWARLNEINPNMLAHVIYNGYYAPKIVKALREQGLYDLIESDVRTKIEDVEASKKEAAREIING